VDFATKRLKPMDLSGLRGALRELVGASKPRILISGVAFDAQGRLVAFAVVSGGGWRETAFAFRREGSDWKRIETKVVAEVAEVEPGAPVLETVRALPDPRKSFELYPPGLPATEETVRKLGAALPGQDLSGQWMSWSLPGGTLHYRSQHDLDDTWFPSSPMRWEQDGKLVALEGLTEKPGEHIGFQLREGLLLVVQFDSRSVHVFDTRTKKSLVSLKGVDAPTFWPEATSGVTQD
jgi:hypothetical protein